MKVSFEINRSYAGSKPFKEAFRLSTKSEIPVRTSHPVLAGSSSLLPSKSGFIVVKGKLLPKRRYKLSCPHRQFTDRQILYASETHNLPQSSINHSAPSINMAYSVMLRMSRPKYSNSRIPAPKPGTTYSRREVIVSHGCAGLVCQVSLHYLPAGTKSSCAI